MTELARHGRQLRALRHREGLTQAALAERLGVSPSYLNLLENDRRPLTAALLIRLAQRFEVDLRAFGGGDEARLQSDLRELFADPLFDDHPLGERALRELAGAQPDVARAVLHLHHAYRSARASAEALAERVLDTGDVSGVDRARLSSEQVSDLIQRNANHFPELEEAAAATWGEGRLERATLFESLCRHVERAHGVRVRIRTVAEMAGAVRRFHPGARELHLSEVLRRGSRNFHVAHQIGLLACGDALDRITGDPQLTSDESRALARVALASYFAGAVLMPYDEFRAAAEALRYDIELLGHRFRASFEQVCHRLTTLNRRGDEGIPFHMVRVDIAGNISKKFSADRVRFPRFGGLCPLWNVHAAFLNPGMIRAQLTRLPDGGTFFSVARTVRKHTGDYHAPDVLYAIGLGCDVSAARRLIYADGVDLRNLDAAVRVGITCRLCERMDCQARAFPSLHAPLRVDANVRGLSFYAPVGEGAPVAPDAAAGPGAV
jgi:predicted transcriptional regulator/transcriptional regulator with XRE-family HTH domain